MRRTAFASIAVVVSAATLVSAQPAATPQFEVASVKRTVSEQGPRGVSFSPGGRFAWNQMTLEQLMASAFASLQTKDIVGGPDWVVSARFDIAATSADALKEIGPDGAPIGLFTRLRALLEDRFALKTHVETRTIPVYALEPAASPFAAGQKLGRVDVDCGAVTREIAAGRRPAVPEGQMPPCAMRAGPGRINGHGMTTAMLSDALSSPAGRPVIDRTSLHGSFDVDLSWAPEYPPGALVNGAPPPQSDGPSIFTAVREQLGLRLTATRAPVPVLVIDSASLPAPD